MSWNGLFQTRQFIGIPDLIAFLTEILSPLISPGVKWIPVMLGDGVGAYTQEGS